MKRSADWKGKLEKRFRFKTFSFEWGRMCYKTDALGNTNDWWWEWEK